MLKVDLAGKIRNTRLPRSKPLLPMFDAVVNSFQAIEDAPGGVISPKIEVKVERESVLEGTDVEGEVNGFTITDNGVGFDDVNLDSFFTSDTQYKVRRGGKGLGRFIWLKAFDYVEIESLYRENGRLLRRAFRFTVDGEEPGPPSESTEKDRKTTVKLVGLKAEYKCPSSLKLIGHRLIEHCLPFFLDPKCPLVVIADNEEQIDLKH